MSNCVTRDVSAGVCVLTLVAPEMRNAISVEMRECLRDLLAEALADGMVRAVILTGEGGHFSSGGQIKQAANGAFKPDPERTRANVAVLHDIVRQIATAHIPVIAAVEGSAYGAGMSLAAACDIVVAGQGVRFGAAFAKVGLMPDAGLIWTLAQRVGRGTAREMLFTGRTIRAEEALATGLANAVVPEGQALAEARSMAEGLKGVAPLALAAIKRVLGERSDSLEDVLAAELELQPELTLSRDYAEGRAAFREKRPPVFAGA